MQLVKRGSVIGRQAYGPILPRDAMLAQY